MKRTTFLKKRGLTECFPNGVRYKKLTAFNLYRTLREFAAEKFPEEMTVSAEEMPRGVLAVCIPSLASFIKLVICSLAGEPHLHVSVKTDLHSFTAIFSAKGIKNEIYDQADKLSALAKQAGFRLKWDEDAIILYAQTENENAYYLHAVSSSEFRQTLHAVFFTENYV